MFDRLLNQFHSIHNRRQNDPRPFEVLWEKTCTELRKHKDATTYARWKQESIIKNARDYQALSSEIAETWANIPYKSNDDGIQTCSFAAHEHFDELIRRQQALKPRAKSNIDDILEVSIAYWIEARNAFNRNDSIRALHALLECNFFLGMTYSPKTESEAKREIASKASVAPRDALEEIAYEVMLNFVVPKDLESAQYLPEKIVEQIRLHPGGAEALQAYDDHIQIKNPTTELIDHRFADALAKWGKSGKPYKRMKLAYDRILKELQQKQSKKINHKKRQK